MQPVASINADQIETSCLITEGNRLLQRFGRLVFRQIGLDLPAITGIERIEPGSESVPGGRVGDGHRLSAGVNRQKTKGENESGSHSTNVAQFDRKVLNEIDEFRTGLMPAGSLN
jgi:hypothetical protein